VQRRSAEARASSLLLNAIRNKSRRLLLLRLVVGLADCDTRVVSSCAGAIRETTFTPPTSRNRTKLLAIPRSANWPSGLPLITILQSSPG